MTGPRFLVHTRPDCPFCEKAKNLLIAEGFEFDEHIHFTQAERLAFKEKLLSDTFPLIFDLSNNKRVGGYAQLVEYTFML